MLKNILVPATGAATDAAVFATALLAAKPFAAHLEFLHVKTDVTELIVAMSASGAPGLDVKQLAERLEQECRAQEQRAWEAFATFCAAGGIVSGGGAPGAGLSADMYVETGSEARWLAEFGRFTDLTVLGRAREGVDVAMDLLEASLMDTGRPLLIAPATAPATLLDNVLIAWKDTPEAARAVAAAWPFIDRAGHVTILTVEEDTAAPADSTERLQRSLIWHNATTTVRRVRRDGRPAVDVLLQAVAAERATLLVMGGYSHSRLHEVVFGGVTLRVLRDAALPVLMAH